MRINTSPEAATLFNIKETTFKIGEQDVHIETGHMAKAASGSVVLTCGDTKILVTATISKEPRAGIDFFPLLCDFEERMYSVGRIPGGFIKREGRPSEKAVLSCRLMDRPIRPLWPDGYKNDVQVVAMPLSADGVQQTDVLSILAASFALCLSGGPFQGPLGAVRIGQINGEFVLNPTFQDMEESSLDLIVSGTADSIMMVEAGADFIDEETLVKALEVAQAEISRQCAVQEKFTADCGVTQVEYTPALDSTELNAFVAQHCEADVEKAYHNFDRDERKNILADTKTKMKEAIDALPDDHALQPLIQDKLDHVGAAFKGLEKRVMRKMVITEGVRADGRKADEIRPIFCEVGIVPRVHGSALFTRGGTQVLSITTLGSPGDKQKLDGVDPELERRWIHHYSFPGYSVGEVRPLRGPGRREIGHGALAGRAIAATLPDKEAFPYTMRVNSDVLESNGSSSMGSTCGSSMSLMNAGVPLKAPIGGIAMGLIKEGDQAVVLSDIQGLEDFLGDMDFKVTGNDTGITALQMDIKIKGISVELLRSALEQARLGRLHILGKMAEAIENPMEMAETAPRILSIRVPKESIGSIIGPGGKNIRALTEETGSQIDIEEDGDTGLVTITSVGTGGEVAYDRIHKMTMKIDAGMILPGKVVRIIPIGAFVELAPGRDGMVHISQISNERVNVIEDYLKVGDEVTVKVREIDNMGRINLTMKGFTAEERAEHGLPEPEAPQPVASND